MKAFNFNSFAFICVFLIFQTLINGDSLMVCRQQSQDQKEDEDLIEMVKEQVNKIFQPFAEKLKKLETAMILFQQSIGESWSEWQKWSGCSVSCGIGNRRRNRNCTRGDAGSHYCPGSDEQMQECDLGTCVDGKVGNYTRVEIGSSVYAIFYQAMSWSNGKNHCELFGGSLAKVLSVEENERLLAEIRKFPRKKFYHIGANDINGTRFNWLWPDQDRVVFLNWNSGEPNSRIADQNCVSMQVPSGKWSDHFCYSLHHFICQKGLLGAWSSWGSCSRTCGNGQQTRQRPCGGFTPGSSSQRTYCRDQTFQSRMCSNAEACSNDTK